MPITVDVTKMKNGFKDYTKDINYLKSSKINSFVLPGRVARMVNKIEKKLGSKHYISVKGTNEKIKKANNHLKMITKNVTLANKIHIGNFEELINNYIGTNVIDAFKFMCNISFSGSKAGLGNVQIDDEIKVMEAFVHKYPNPEGNHFYASTLDMERRVQNKIDKIEGSKGLALGGLIRSTKDLIQAFNEKLVPKELLAYKKRGDNTRGTWTERYLENLDISFAGLETNELKMSGAPMLESIQKIYKPYLEEAEKMNMMFKSVDKKMKSR